MEVRKAISPDGLDDLLREIKALPHAKPKDGFSLIPLTRLLYLMYASQFTHTVLVSKSVISRQVHAEHSGSDSSNFDQFVTRLDFFKEDPTTVESDVDLSHIYGGCCEIRSDATISDAFISTSAISSSKQDRYAFYTCTEKRTCQVKVNGNCAEVNITIDGFAYMQKNNRETMCAQSSIMSILRYWQARLPAHKVNDIKTTIDLNRYAGFQSNDKEILGHGLSGTDIFKLSQNAEFPVLIVSAKGIKGEFKARFWRACKHAMRGFRHAKKGGWSQGTKYACKWFCQEINGPRPSRFLYALIESRIPVFLGVHVKMGQQHALTVFGHTHDRNSWAGISDYLYYSKHSGLNYHSNTLWIKNFIIHDDNMGPYMFMSSEQVDKVFSALIAFHPKISKLKTDPTRIEEAVSNLLFSPGFKSLFQKTGAQLRKEHPKHFKQLLNFYRHIKEPDSHANGFVLRTFLREGAHLINRYTKHDPGLAEVVAKIISEEGEEDLFWVVEITLADLYCYAQQAIGMAVLNGDGHIILVHIPGMLLEITGEPTCYLSLHSDDMFNIEKTSPTSDSEVGKTKENTI